MCEPECPADAIRPDTAPDPGEWPQINREYAALWPDISVKGEPSADCDDWMGKSGKQAFLPSHPAKAA